jgi:hypothetical protein
MAYIRLRPVPRLLSVVSTMPTEMCSQKSFQHSVMHEHTRPRLPALADRISKSWRYAKVRGNNGIRTMLMALAGLTQYRRRPAHEEFLNE